MALAAIEDLTARARIRDAAMRLFTERGYAGASIRDIAEAAGVSPGLIRHHFGSKEQLSQACDAHAFAVFRGAKERALDPGVVRDAMFVATAYATAAPAARYLGRALADGSPGAAALFDDMVAFARQMLSGGVEGISPRTSDLPAYAAVLTAMNLGVLVLYGHVQRVLGADEPARLAQAMLDIHSHRLIQEPYAEALALGIQSLGNDGARRRPGRRPRTGARR